MSANRYGGVRGVGREILQRLDGWITSRAAAARLKCSVGYIGKLIHRRDLEARRVEDADGFLIAVVVSAESVEKFKMLPPRRRGLAPGFKRPAAWMTPGPKPLFSSSNSQRGK